jgi:hypothetical protein
MIGWNLTREPRRTKVIHGACYLLAILGFWVCLDYLPVRHLPVGEAGKNLNNKRSAIPWFFGGIGIEDFAEYQYRVFSLPRHKVARPLRCLIRERVIDRNSRCHSGDIWFQKFGGKHVEPVGMNITLNVPAEQKMTFACHAISGTSSTVLEDDIDRHSAALFRLPGFFAVARGQVAYSEIRDNDMRSPRFSVLRLKKYQSGVCGLPLEEVDYPTDNSHENRQTRKHDHVSVVQRDIFPSLLAWGSVAIQGFGGAVLICIGLVRLYWAENGRGALFWGAMLLIAALLLGHAGVITIEKLVRT